MKLHHLQGYIQSVYLAEYSDKLLLLDGCSRADIPMLKRFICNGLARPLTDLKLVVVTHMHPDHAGAVHKLKSLTGCKVAASGVSGQWYAGINGKLMHLTDILLAKWVAHRLKKPNRSIRYPSKLYADYQLEDGDLLPGFTDWKAIETQGHTDRDLSLHHLPSDRVYVADLMVKVKGRYIPPFPVFYPNRYKASLQKIVSLNPATLALAHGGLVKPTKDEYDHLIALAPNVPKTHLRTVKAFIKKVFHK
ncbi:Zn-dependent hydrolase [Marinomonas sp. SBI22]|uniref:MBL fold metallo-hydrolase n=1 Tax=unclassified Marinomonas TaxID=196814 RepID=UPI0007AF2AB8|nr:MULTISPECIES: MBL fold metallo-hydrolase [unclassified Marinomonas]KZM38735.1 Zn-dependent hydrolase [Marinomonas sp. SBI22]KZM39390.1 Zn-dependent hydrolase [Marinomonas sp. SBI8L]